MDTPGIERHAWHRAEEDEGGRLPRFKNVASCPTNKAGVLLTAGTHAVTMLTANTAADNKDRTSGSVESAQ